MLRYGQASRLLSWAPGDALVALAGGVGVPFARFSALVVAGKLALYLTVTLAASAL